jgi:hypothetical protein
MMAITLATGRNQRWWPRAVVAMVSMSMLLATQAPADAAATHVSYVINAHPDDEMNMWSLIEGSSGNFKVFAFMTQGEQTSACATDWYEEGTGEINPLTGVGQPGTWGRNSPNCYEGRRRSTLNFLADISAQDPAIPGTFADRGTVTISNQYGLAWPINEHAGGSYIANKVRVLEDTGGRGVVLFFDLGDGDLGVDEIRWAVAAMRNNKSLLKIPTTLPERNAIGNYRVGNSAYSNCRQYDHVDHRRVHEALWNHDMFDARQHGRTCGSDPDRDTTRTKVITATIHTFMFEVVSTQRVGKFDRRYGWLFGGDNHPGGWYNRTFLNGPTSATASPPDCGHPTSVLYRCGSTGSRVQHFWTRFS